MAEPIRILTAVPICDGHDSAIVTINMEFIRHGIEVIYLGYNRSARDVVRAAIQEGVRAIGLSSYNGGHVEFFSEVLALLRKREAGHIGVFGGGGGTITKADAALLHRRGVDRIFFAGTPFDEMIRFVKSQYGRNRPPGISRRQDECLRRFAAENGGKRVARAGAPVIGITGPGGTGKTTLIDELVLRFLAASPMVRVAILSHDPSVIGKGALLGDRAAMIYSQDDRVFMRSLATAGTTGGLSPATGPWLRKLKRAGVDVVLVETVGIGQEAMPFPSELVEKRIFVMSPEYGSRLQLQKIVMLDAADIVVVNKSDTAGAPTAYAEVQQRIAVNGREQKLVATTATRHRDPGVDALFNLVARGVIEEASLNSVSPQGVA